MLTSPLSTFTPETLRKVISSDSSEFIPLTPPSTNLPAPGFKISMVGLGDVGSNLLLGLRLLSKETLSQIGIYGRKENTIQRFLHEMNQVSPAFDPSLPPVVPLKEAQLFDADVFLFCASKQIPPLGTSGDVRLMQLEENRKILKSYLRLAAQKKFKGIFAIVSDPVDLLCLCALEDSSPDGLAPRQIRGFGLGVMNARALFYAAQNPITASYAHDGRCYGPHGKGLIVANSITQYNHEESLALTQKVLEANLTVRALGFKPFIAPALSSGSLSIISMLKGQPHYSAVYVEGVYLGICNRLCIEELQHTTLQQLPCGALSTEVEQLPLPEELFHRIAKTHALLLDHRRTLRQK